MRSTIPALTIALLLTAGCGSTSAAPKPNGEASKTAVQVFNDAEAALNHASSVHVAGTVAMSQGKGIRVDAVSVPGKGGTASATAGDVSFKVIAVNDGVYIQGNKAFSGGASALRGKWLRCSPNSTMGAKASLTSASGFFLRPDPKVTSLLKNEGETTYHGERAVEIRSTAAGVTFYVAATGTPYPLALVANGDVVRFDDFNAPVALSAPTNAIAVPKYCGKLP